ncbi:MAG TPA: DNA repair protein RecN [Gammaproteobacteria bacterium]|nr:DNA repair protein RecN [Gammaproteobacteria bacterium]
MLTHIHVRNLAIVDEIDVELTAGMTALTGETGAGKSILVDALGLVLGDRADSSVVRHGCERAEISAGFDIRDNAGATTWLVQRDLDMEGECQLRRIISREGRTRGYINGQTAPMQSLRELGELLVDIHGQHEHQSLLRSDVQRELLDAFGGHQKLLSQTGSIYNDWKAAIQGLEAVISDAAERDARLDLLRYQLQELEALELSSEAIRNIDAEHARQANAGHLLAASQQALNRLDAEEGNSAYILISKTLEQLKELSALDSRLEETTRLLDEAAVLVQEGTDTLRNYSDSLEIDPERLQWLEQRTGLLHDLARKHRCTPGDLPEIETNIRLELEHIENADQHRDALQAKLASLEQTWLATAKQLSGKRRKAARTFNKEITASMQTLGMKGGVFEVSIKTRKDPSPGSHGLEDIEFMVSANTGQPVQPLSKVASGGELSRVSLSIQVISAGGATIPTMIFDEVDSGIGGGVAEIVGQKLRALGTERQVLCVTHLPQVAALANQQMQVTKLSGEESTRTRIRTLNEEERVDELARMLGGVKITKQTREHAREMMQLAGNPRADKPSKKRTKQTG